MSKLILVIVLIFLNGFVYSQEENQTTLDPGMRGTPLNLPDISVIGDIVGKISTDENDERIYYLAWEKC